MRKFFTSLFIFLVAASMIPAVSFAHDGESAIRGKADAEHAVHIRAGKGDTDDVSFAASASTTANISLETDKKDKEDGNNKDTDNESDKHHVCNIVPPGHLIALGWLREHGGIRPIVPPCQILPPGILNHEHERKHPTSTLPDVTPPIITLIAVTPSSTSAVISWKTRELSNSQVFYGLTTTYGSSTAVNTAFVAAHRETITGLDPSTTYHFRVQSKDAAGNTATSGDQTLTTNALPDTTPPVILSTGVSASSTSAVISWVTNEAATSKVYFGSVSPLNIMSTSTFSVSNTTLATSHTIGITGLTTSTTYFFIIESANAASNSTTSTQQSFTTL